MVRILAEADRITLVIEGLPEDEGQVRFSAFMAQLQSLSATISKLDRDVSGGKASSLFKIAEISYSSPIRIVLEPEALPKRDYAGQKILESLGRVTEAIGGGQSLDGIDADLLDDIRALARPVGKQIKSAMLIFNAHQFELTERVTHRVDDALKVEDECQGAIEGDLEQINIHQGANIFHIYPSIGPRKVTCNFPARFYDEAVAAVGRRVEVSGLLRYRSGASYPHQIVVSGIDAFPPEADLPTWDDLRGRAPNATGDLSSEAFVRELRDAWS